jgi:hypothetical protein
VATEIRLQPQRPGDRRLGGDTPLVGRPVPHVDHARQRQVVDYVVEGLRHRAAGDAIVLGGDPHVVLPDEPIAYPL